MRFQTETSNINEHDGIRYLPYCFTEAGVAMLATIIKTSIAAEMSIKAGTKSFMIIKIEDDNIKDVIIENATRLIN